MLYSHNKSSVGICANGEQTTDKTYPDKNRQNRPVPDKTVPEKIVGGEHPDLTPSQFQYWANLNPPKSYFITDSEP